MNECLKCKYEGLVIDLHLDWDTVYDGIYAYNRNGSCYTNFEATLSNGSRVSTVDKHNTDSWGSGGYEGEYPQGSEFDAWVVIKVESPSDGILFFKKNGTANSYGTVTWGGRFQQVKAVEKIVTVFEPSYEVV